MLEFLKYQKLTFLWALFILIICSVSLGKAGESHLFFRGFDKLTHTGLFFVFTVFTFYGIIRKHGSVPLPFFWFILIPFVAFVFGGVIELLQWKVFTYRSGDWNDLFCDVLGSLMGVFCIWITTNAIQSKTK